jgi:hypothetical protein
MTKVRSTASKFVAAAWLAVLTAGCGDLVRQGRGPSQVVITRLEAASGAEPEEFGGTLSSDVITLVDRQLPGGGTTLVPTIFADLGQVTMTLVLKDPATLDVANTPSVINQVTFTRYRVTYRRADGRNSPGVDIPYAFDGAMTLTVPPSGEVTGSFLLVRQTAKQEAPLRSLQTSNVLLQAIADVTFYGQDQAGNEVAASGSILVTFGDFGDPE